MELHACWGPLPDAADERTISYLDRARIEAKVAAKQATYAVRAYADNPLASDLRLWEVEVLLARIEKFSEMADNFERRLQEELQRQRPVPPKKIEMRDVVWC